MRRQVRVLKDRQEKILHRRTGQSAVRAERQAEVEIVHVAVGETDAAAAQLMATLAWLKAPARQSLPLAKSMRSLASRKSHISLELTSHRRNKTKNRPREIRSRTCPAKLPPAGVSTVHRRGNQVPNAPAIFIPN